MITLLHEAWQNPRKRRDSVEIVARILKVASGGVHKTQIMYEAGLSFAQLTAYLTLLVRLELLEVAKKNEKVIYRTTIKGNQYLKSYEQITHILRKNTEHRLSVI